MVECLKEGRTCLNNGGGSTALAQVFIFSCDDGRLVVIRGMFCSGDSEELFWLVSTKSW